MFSRMDRDEDIFLEGRISQSLIVVLLSRYEADILAALAVVESRCSGSGTFSQRALQSYYGG